MASGIQKYGSLVRASGVGGCFRENGGDKTGAHSGVGNIASGERVIATAEARLAPAESIQIQEQRAPPGIGELRMRKRLSFHAGCNREDARPELIPRGCSAGRSRVPTGG